MLAFSCEVSMTFGDVLLALQGPWVNTAVGLLITFAVEYVPGFCNLSQKSKRLAVGGLSLLVPLAACAVGVAMGYQSAEFDASWWPALSSGGLAFIAATLAHTRKLEG